MKKKTPLWFIKERHNPQFDKPYYVTYGQLTRKRAKELEEAAYGSNVMLPYTTEEEYKAAIDKLLKRGFNVSAN